jgi:gentisate 1,2-dioxygenase
VSTDIQPMIFHHSLPGVYIREQRLWHPGAVIETHRHATDHFGILGSGLVTVVNGEETKQYAGPCVIPIKAHVAHRITAHTPITWFCVHAVPPELDSEGVLTYVEHTVVEG